MARAALSRYGEQTPETQPYYARGGPTLLSETPAAPMERKPDRRAESQWTALYEHYESRRAALYTWRLPHWVTWGQIARYERPDRYYLWITENTYQHGLRKDQAIVDRTATLCGEVCAAGLMAGLTDPDRDWAKFGPGIPGLELDQAGQQWYEDVGERYNYVLTHSNFYDAQAQHYDDLVFFGTAPVIDYADEREILHCFTPCAGEYMLGTGFDNSDEVLYREYRMTVSQIVEMFGVENCPEDVLKMWRQKGGALQNEMVICHAIEPNFPIRDERTGEDVGSIPGGFTWREAYWIRGKKNLAPLEMAGFHEQPFGVSLWNTQGNDAYGRGVGEYMLGDTIQLQLETRQKAEALEKVIRPPMGADVSLQNQPASTSPGKITYMNTGNGGEKKFWPLYEVRPDLAAITADIAIIQERIGRTAYNDIFRMMGNLREETKSGIAPQEVDALKEEALMRMGPVIGRVYGTLRNRVKRHLAIMARRGLIPPKPASLRGVPLKIELISMLTMAQRATATQAVARTAQFVGSISGAWPEALHVLNPEETVRQFSDGVGASSRILNSPAQIKRLALAAQKAAAAQQMAAQTLPGAQAAKALSQTSLEPGSALSALVPGVG